MKPEGGNAGTGTNVFAQNVESNSDTHGAESDLPHTDGKSMAFPVNQVSMEREFPTDLKERKSMECLWMNKNEKKMAKLMVKAEQAETRNKAQKVLKKVKKLAIKMGEYLADLS